jgi:hypothetical protein
MSVFTMQSRFQEADDMIELEIVFVHIQIFDACSKGSNDRDSSGVGLCRRRTKGKTDFSRKSKLGPPGIQASPYMVKTQWESLGWLGTDLIDSKFSARKTG